MSVRLAIVGESWGAEEAARKQPFVGKSGFLLNSVLRNLGIDRDQCLVTNCFNFQPPQNKITNVLVKKDEAAPGFTRIGIKYLPVSLVPEIERMRREIRDFRPQAIIALGAVALWGLTGSSALGTHRGHLHYWEGIPMIPTYHPARCLRQYALKTSMVADILKAKRLAKGDLTPDELHYIAEPTLQQVKDFFDMARGNPCVAVDIETIPLKRAITMIGFGVPHISICVPFFHLDRDGYHYWKDAAEEIAAMQMVSDFLVDKSVGKIFHHGSYDIAWIADVWGMPVKGAVYDTRIMHSNLLAELPHTLTDVAANYLCMPPWKSEWKSAKDSDATTEKVE